jgi:hypothetical protein
MQRSRTEYVIDSRRLTQTITSKLVVVPAGGEENRPLILKESSIARQAISLQYLECRGSIQYQYDSANISTMKLYCVLAVSFVASFGNAFSPGILRSHRSTENARNTASSVHQFLVVDPSMLPLDISLDVAFDAGIAALSAAAGRWRLLVSQHVWSAMLWGVMIVPNYYKTIGLGKSRRPNMARYLAARTDDCRSGARC